MKELEKRILGVWIVGAFVISTVLGGILGSIVGALFNISTVLSVSGVFSVLVILFTTYMSLRYQAWGFELREDHLYIEHGVFSESKDHGSFCPDPTCR